MIDDIDREILRILQREGRKTQRDLGAEIKLSPNATGARIQRLFDRGVISGVHARVDPAALGRPIEATVDLWRHDDADDIGIRNVVQADDRIVECFHLTGPLDYRARVRVASPDDLNDLLTRLKNEAGIRQTDTRLVLEHLDVTPLA